MTVGILLAAGRSSRFSQTGQAGQLKQLAKLPSGQTLLEASTKNLRAGCGDIERLVIVVSHDAALIEHANKIAHEYDCEVVINTAAHEGMATSITCGVKHTKGASGWLIALADMPFIQPASISAIAAALVRDKHPDQIIVPTYNGERGHPVAFAAKYADALCQLTGDTGARDLIRLHQSFVVLLPLDDAGILNDIDTESQM